LTRRIGKMKAKKEINVDLWSSKKVCEFFEITRTTLSNWRKFGFPGPGGREGYDIFKVFKWYRRNIITSPEGERSLSEEKLHYSQARTRLKELELRKAEGGLLERPTVMSWFQTIIGEAKQLFRQIPRRVAESLVGRTAKEIELILLREIDDVLFTMAGATRREVTELQPWEQGIFEIVVKDGRSQKVVKKRVGT
jgi:hypothetical protein